MVLKIFKMKIHLGTMFPSLLFNIYIYNLPLFILIISNDLNCDINSTSEEILESIKNNFKISKIELYVGRDTDT